MGRVNIYMPEEEEKKLHKYVEREYGKKARATSLVVRMAIKEYIEQRMRQGGQKDE